MKRLFVILFLCLPLLAVAAQPTSTPTPSPSLTPSPSVTIQRQSELDDFEARLQLQERISIVRILKQVVVGGGMLSLILVGALIYGIYRGRTYLGEQDTSMDMLVEFHRQALSELRWYLTFTLLASILGITIISASAIVALIGLTTVGIAGTVAGLITEALGALFFKQMKESRARVMGIEKQLFDYKMMTTQIEQKQKTDAIAVPPSNQLVEADSANS